MTKSSVLGPAIEAVDFFRGLLVSEAVNSPPDIDVIIVQYVALRRELAEIFRKLSNELLVGATPSLTAAVMVVEERMGVLFGSIAPPHLFVVKRYHSIHSLLFEYLVRHLGESVSATRFRVLTGDQVHTERRIRELRDLGFTILVTGSSSNADYLLLSPHPDADKGARTQLKLNVKEDKKLPKAQRQQLLNIIDSLS